MADTTMAAAQVRAGRREWLGMAVLALPTLLVSVDVFVLLLALPRLSADLSATSTEQLWISDMYGFVLSGFLVTMGALGDRIGRRRILLLGAAGFGAASVWAAYSTSPAMLVAARAALGVAGATLAPSTMSLISTMFRDPRQRALAFAVWMGCFNVGAAVGPLVGGAMLDRFWWGSVFLLGVPAMVLLLVLGPVVLPEYRAPRAARLDPASVALSLAAVLPVVYGVKELARHGWRPLPVATVAAGVAVGMVFVRRQRRLADPMLDLRVFANRTFSGATGTMLVGTMLIGAMMLFVTQYLELVRGLTPFSAGLCMLPAVVGMVASSFLSTVLARRFRPAHLIAGGLAVAVVGLLLLTVAGPDSGLGVVVVAFALNNIGGGPMVVLGVDLVIGSAPPEKAGAAAAITETGGQFGYALGLAVLGSIGTLVYRSRVADAVPAGTPAGAARAARDTLAGAAAAAHGLPHDLGAALLAPARAAFTHGMHVAAGISAVLLAGAAVVVATVLRDAGRGDTGADGGPDPAEQAEQAGDAPALPVT